MSAWMMIISNEVANATKWNKRISGKMDRQKISWIDRRLAGWMDA